MSARSSWRRVLYTRGDALLTIALFTVLVVVLATIQERERPARPYDLDSGEPQGLLALRLWLEEDGYDVTTTGRRRFALDDDVRLLFVHPGARSFSDADAQTLEAWVEAGNTLVLVGTHNNDRALMQAFDLSPDFAQRSRLRDAQQVLPMLPEAPATITNTVMPGVVSTAGLDTALAVLTSGAQPTLAVMPLGAGTVWFLSEDYSLTNEELATSGQGYLLPAFVRRVPAGGRVAFDTYHQADVTADLAFSSLQDWLYRTPTGWALLFAAVVLFGALVWQGRRLGPALAPQSENRRREAAEFVTAMANLQRRAHQRAMVAAHHHQRFKAALGARYQVTPDLADDDFVRALATSERPPTPDTLAALREVLAGLRGGSNEAALVQWVARSDEILHNLAKET